MSNELIFSTEQRAFMIKFVNSVCQPISMREIERVFHDKIISRDLLPPRSLNMTPFDFYLWGRLKNAVYKISPRTLEELKRNIRDEINNINRGELQ